MKKLYLSIIFILSLLILSGCSTNETEEVHLKITGISSALGQYDVDPKYQQFSYEIIVTNMAKDEVTVKAVEPVIVQNIIERMDEKNLEFNVNKNLSQEEAIFVKNNFLFDATNLTKQQMSQLDFIAGVNVTLSNNEVIFIKR